MMRPWWENDRAEAVVEDGRPVLFPDGRKALLDALRLRMPGFVPEWRDLTDDDAGVALVRLFGAQLEPILARAERLPEKALIEFLSTAGTCLSPPRSARAMVQLTPRSTNTEPVIVPEGFSLLSARADDEKGDVNWETEASLSVGNIELKEAFAFDGELVLNVPIGEEFQPLGEKPRINAALYLGFEVVGESGGSLAIGFDPATEGTPAPVAAGGSTPPGSRPADLRWEALTDRGFVRVDVPQDGSELLTRTGIVRFVLPNNWSAGRPPALGDGEPLFWLRLRLSSGNLASPPEIAGIYLHAVGVVAQKTHRNEFPIPENEGVTKSVRLSQTPVLPGSVVLEIDEGVASNDPFELADESTATNGRVYKPWKEVETLAGQRPDARVFTLDSVSGTLQFGDNREGLAPPPGIRNIAVRSYATTSGAAGNVTAEEINRMPNPLNGIEAASNPLFAAGGTAIESLAHAVERGPAAIKARGRAVTAGDVALMAPLSEGANIVRAFAISGVDPEFPGALRPGTVGVFVIARRHPSQPEDVPPLASSESLGAVASYLAEEVGPEGARISVSNPRYHSVRVEATVTIEPGMDAGAATSAITSAINTWLNPERIGEGSGNWEIGALIRHADLTHVLINADKHIVSVPFLALTVDGISYPGCEDVRLSRFGLPWPGQHQLLVQVEESAL